MRILMAVHNYPYPILGGLERQAHILSKALIRQGIQVTVISGRVLQDQPDSEIVEGVRVFRLPWQENTYLRLLGTPVPLILAMIKLRSHFDVIHIHNLGGFGACALLLTKLLQKPVLVKLPNVGIFGIPGIRTRRLGNTLLRLYKQSDAFVALCEESVNELKDIGYPTERILRVSNGVPLEKFSTSSESKRQTSMLKPLKVIFIGRLSQEKGVVDLLSIWNRVLRGSDRPVLLDICGTGPLEKEINELIQKLSISDTVSMKGHVLNIEQVLKNADIFVLPSYAEGNSNAILEAMASQLPVVSTRVGGTPALLGPEGKDFLIRPGDTNSLAAQLIKLISNDHLRVTLGETMLARAQRYFGIDAVAKRYINAYTCLMVGKREQVGSNSSLGSCGIG